MNFKFLIIFFIYFSFEVIECERKTEKFKFNVNDQDISGTPIQKGFKAGYFGALKAEDKSKFAAGAARCAGEPTTTKIMEAWQREEDGPFKDAGIACHKAATEWSVNAKQAFVAGASVGASNALLVKGVTKLKLKEVKPSEE